MKHSISLLVAAIFLLTISGVPAEPQGAQDFEIQVRLRREQALREKEQEELKAATKELQELTSVLVERVALADGYTTDAKLLEYSDREQALREKEQEELKAATKELQELTSVLVERVALADGYTTDAKLLEYSDQVQELAKQIEDLAKTINQRARGR